LVLLAGLRAIRIDSNCIRRDSSGRNGFLPFSNATSGCKAEIKQILVNDCDEMNIRNAYR
jgi:hypothetical protein